MGLLRLLLALSVVAAHYGDFLGLTYVGGQIAVQAFYIISGFYMALILNEKYIGVNNSYRLFITNRFMRLYPIYWIVLIGTILVSLGLGLMTRGQFIPKIDSYLSVKLNIWSFAYLILTNIVIFGQDLVLFLGINPGTGHLFFTNNFANTSPPLHSFVFISQAWTLGLELTFYLLAPFIIKRGLKIVVILIALSLMLRLILYNYFSLQHDPWTYRFFPTEFMFFLLGYLSYRIQLVMKTRSIPKYFNVGVLIFVLAFTTFYNFIPSFKAGWFPFSLKEVIYFSTIILSIPLLFNFLKKNRMDNKIGELSYPVYICHVLVSEICSIIAGRFPSVSFIKENWIMGMLTIIFAWLLNRLIANPIENYRQSRLRKIPAPNPQ